MFTRDPKPNLPNTNPLQLFKSTTGITTHTVTAYTHTRAHFYSRNPLPERITLRSPFLRLLRCAASRVPPIPPKRKTVAHSYMPSRGFGSGRLFGGGSMMGECKAMGYVWVCRMFCGGCSYFGLIEKLSVCSTYYCRVSCDNVVIVSYDS